MLAALCFAACTDDPLAVCHGDEPVHLLRIDGVFQLFNYRADEYTLLTTSGLRDDYVTAAGPACGVGAVSIVDGLRAPPMRVHEDPRDDDPTIVCSDRGSLFRVDLDGEAAPTLLLPGFSCSGAIRTDHGPALVERSPYGLWLFPDFPDLESARRITASLDVRLPRRLIGDELFHARGDGELWVHDLATGADTRLLTHVAEYTTTATHVLWREQTAARAAPMWILDRATGTSTYLGLYRTSEDEFVPGSYRQSITARAWSIARDGRAVLHFPLASYAPLAAYDLAGRPLAFPAWGTLWLLLDDGRVILGTDAGLVAARPGDTNVIALDAPERFEIIKRRGDHLEALVASELYHVALDGTASRLLARGVGHEYAWLDDDHIITVYESILTTIQPSTTHRSKLAHDVTSMSPAAPGEGVYYSVVSGWSDYNGVWFMPEAGLRPPPARCFQFDACNE